MSLTKRATSPAVSTTAKHLPGSSRIISFGEQGLLSTVNFCASIILARFLHIEEFGAYALAFTLLTLLQGFQRMLVGISIVVLTPDRHSLHLHHRNWQVVQALVTGAPLLLVIFLLFILHDPWAQNVLLALTILLVPMSYYEFYRRWLIQEGKSTLLPQMALAYSMAFLSTLLFISIHGGNAIMAAGGMAAGAAAAASIGFIASAHSRRAQTSSAPPFRPFWRDLWEFGRWQLMSFTAYAGYNALIPVIVSGILGPAAVALMSVTRNMGQPIATLVIAIDNVDKPRASAALAAGGIPAMLASLRNTAITLLVPGALYLMLIGVFAEGALHHLFAGKYDHGVLELRLWLPVYLLILISQPVDSALYILRRPKTVFRGRLWAALVGLFAAIVLAPIFGVPGALIAMTLGWLVSLGFGWHSLKMLVRSHHAHP